MNKVETVSEKERPSVEWNRVLEYVKEMRENFENITNYKKGMFGQE